jgi:hypothetical protein
MCCMAAAKVGSCRPQLTAWTCRPMACAPGRPPAASCGLGWGKEGEAVGACSGCTRGATVRLLLQPTRIPFHALRTRPHCNLANRHHPMSAHLRSTLALPPLRRYIRGSYAKEARRRSAAMSARGSELCCVTSSELRSCRARVCASTGRSAILCASVDGARSVIGRRAVCVGSTTKFPKPRAASPLCHWQTSLLIAITVNVLSYITELH